jgi:hypothetical protein
VGVSCVMVHLVLEPNEAKRVYFTNVFIQFTSISLEVKSNKRLVIHNVHAQLKRVFLFNFVER